MHRDLPTVCQSLSFSSIPHSILVSHYSRVSTTNNPYNPHTLDKLQSNAILADGLLIIFLSIWDAPRRVYYTNPKSRLRLQLHRMWSKLDTNGGKMQTEQHTHWLYMLKVLIPPATFINHSATNTLHHMSHCEQKCWIARRSSWSYSSSYSSRALYGVLVKLGKERIHYYSPYSGPFSSKNPWWWEQASNTVLWSEDPTKLALGRPQQDFDLVRKIKTAATRKLYGEFLSSSKLKFCRELLLLLAIIYPSGMILSESNNSRKKKKKTEI